MERSERRGTYKPRTSGIVGVSTCGRASLRLERAEQEREVPDSRSVNQREARAGRSSVAAIAGRILHHCRVATKSVARWGQAVAEADQDGELLSQRMWAVGDVRRPVSRSCGRRCVSITLVLDSRTTSSASVSRLTLIRIPQQFEFRGARSSVSFSLLLVHHDSLRTTSIEMDLNRIIHGPERKPFDKSGGRLRKIVYSYLPGERPLPRLRSLFASKNPPLSVSPKMRERHTPPCHLRLVSTR